jgi:hypothetical protein
MKLNKIPPTALAASQPPAHSKHTTQLLTEPKPDAHGAVLKEPATGWESFPAGERQAGAFLHWGINE